MEKERAISPIHYLVHHASSQWEGGKGFWILPGPLNVFFKYLKKKVLEKNPRSQEKNYPAELKTTSSVRSSSVTQKYLRSNIWSLILKANQAVLQASNKQNLLNLWWVFPPPKKSSFRFFKKNHGTTRTKKTSRFFKWWFQELPIMTWNPLMVSFQYHSHIFRDSYG